MSHEDGTPPNPAQPAPAAGAPGPGEPAHALPNPPGTAEAHEHSHHHHGDHPHAEHHGTHHGNYVKVWAILLGLLIVSVVGPMFGHRVITLITAFGVAGVKAYLVAVNFMHLKAERRYIAYLLATCIAFMLLFFAAVSPDVMKHDGRNWVNAAAKNSPLPPGHAAGHGHEEGHAAPAHEEHH